MKKYQSEYRNIWSKELEIYWDGGRQKRKTKTLQNWGRIMTEYSGGTVPPTSQFVQFLLSSYFYYY